MDSRPGNTERYSTHHFTKVCFGFLQASLNFVMGNCGGMLTATRIDARASAYMIAYFSTKHLGTGSSYLMTIKDSSGKPFEGSKLYRLHLPAGVLVKLYWSVTIYDRENARCNQRYALLSRASTTPGIQKNNDGSVDLYFGAKAPEGKQTNWVPKPIPNAALK